MDRSPPFDPRAVANLMLDLADQRSLPLTHIALQKLLYFAHAVFLVENRQPLVSGHFEAWQYGPVHPVVFRAFKGSGRQPIVRRASRTDIVTGRTEAVDPPVNLAAVGVTDSVLKQLGRMRISQLIELSHAKNGPWHRVVNKAKTGVALGMRIDDNVILDNFRNHWVAVAHTAATADREPNEDVPFAA
jgi:uncharacterized phage-associated protein